MNRFADRLSTSPLCFYRCGVTPLTLMVCAAFLCVAALALLLSSPATARAQMIAGRFEEEREDTYVRQADIKAAIVWSRGQEELFLSPRTTGRVTNFAYVVAVPSPPTVGVLRGALFHDLARAAFPKPAVDAAAKPEYGRAASGVQVVSRKVVGAYDVSVLTADDSAALAQWLKRNGYRMPANAAPILRKYVDRGWQFVACRISDPQSAQGIKTGTLAPLRIRFRASRPILPIQFCRTNRGDINLVAYVLIPQRETAVRGLAVVSGPGGRRGETTPLRATLRPDRIDAETLNRIQNGRTMRVYVESQTLAPEECTQDYVWSLSNGRGDDAP